MKDYNKTKYYFNQFNNKTYKYKIVYNKYIS